MSHWVWLIGALAAAVAAYFVAVPAWSSQQARRRRDLNAERYLAWRGRARPPAASRAAPEGLTADERRRLVIAGLALVLAVAALIAFFATS